MSLDFRVWLYGTSTSKTKKTLTRIKDENIAKAKGFHLYFRKSPRSEWQRVTEAIELIPGIFRSKIDKQIYIDSFVETVREALTPKPKVKKPTPPKAPPKPKEPEKEIKLPELPKEPRVTLTKKQFNAQMSRILYDELDLENMKWSEARIDSFIDKMWNSFKHAPHLIASEQFRRGLVSKEIKKLKDKKLRKKEGEMEDAFRKELASKEVSLDPLEVGGDVRVQFKEAFIAQGMKSPEDMTVTTLENGLRVEKPRQSAFAQIHVDYDKMIGVSKESLLAEDSIAKMAFEKTRNDIEKLFDQSIEKGLFKYGDIPEYSIRLLVPLVNGKGEIPADYYSKKGRKRSGHGFSTIREKIKNKKDLKNVLDGLFNAAKPALARYIRLNKSAGFMIAGFTIERLLR